jgi:hypothetical protein
MSDGPLPEATVVSAGDSVLSAQDAKAKEARIITNAKAKAVDLNFLILTPNLSVF